MRLFKEKNNQLEKFEAVVMPHMEAAYNLACWLVGNEQDAEDIVQEATLRAFKFFGSFKGENGYTWFLAIVRNTFYTQLPQKRRQEQTTIFDEEIHAASSEALNPEVILIKSVDTQRLKEALEALAPEYREVIVLRELEELSYKEMADLIGIPIGTVMSRLARSRKRLQQHLTTPYPAGTVRKGAPDEL